MAALIAVAALVHCAALCVAFTCEPPVLAEAPDHAPCHDEGSAPDSSDAPTCEEQPSEQVLPKKFANDFHASPHATSGPEHGPIEVTVSLRIDAPIRAVDATAKSIRTTVLTL
jgi:hypothetical protein